jgi:hypothetical protein
MDLAPPPVGELYVNHEELIAAANTWAGAHGYAVAPTALLLLWDFRAPIEFKLESIARRPTF